MTGDRKERQIWKEIRAVFPHVLRDAEQSRHPRFRAPRIVPDLFDTSSRTVQDAESPAPPDPSETHTKSVGISSSLATSPLFTFPVVA